MKPPKNSKLEVKKKKLRSFAYCFRISHEAEGMESNTSKKKSEDRTLKIRYVWGEGEKLGRKGDNSKP